MASTLGRILIQVIKLHLEQHEAHVAANIQLAVGGPDTTVTLAPPAATVEGQVLPDNDPLQIAILESITAALSTASSSSPSPSSLPSSPPPRSPPKLIHEAAARIILELERVSAPDEIRRLLPRLPPNVIDALQDTVLQRPELPYALIAPTLDLLTKVVQPQKVSGDATPTTKSRDDDDVQMQLDPDGLDDLEKVTAFARARASLLDDWVLDNERIMRARLVLDDPTRRDSVEKAVEALRSIHPTSPSPYSSDGDSSNSYIVDTSSSHWDKFLVALGRDGRHAFTPKTRANADLVTESTWAWTIQRPVGNEVPGVTILDQYRRSVANINKLQTYMRTFDRLTKNVFRGLNWDNIFVAGGIALGALLSDGSEDSEHAWRKSDIE
ncbi:unnamed protein product [Tilletia controversa]|uniref:Uncharacterized protein n=3 Tax=Tilletia TaxID=13289 RepID=A0A8X7MQ39_9BASI|nr:hypothetical protein CF336_g7058 [Tilletia laevis]KAE8188179.1 hypothetical protein CF328_g6683 [Tilletia controversa]KAE8251000.1 hypothetical protein A4X03_0g6425 [Tilletia caries]KAE8190048.1 hypothetical protein CF335_g6464 [Tilletia laevis]KAE8245324.1 hypothetical protein A4X06_0g5734 [Tilletia controversa]